MKLPYLYYCCVYSSQKFWTPTLLSAKYHCYHLHIVNKIPNPSNYTFIFFSLDLQVLCTWQLIWMNCCGTIACVLILAVVLLFGSSLHDLLRVLLLLPSNRSFSFLCYFLHDYKEVTQTQERMKVRIPMNSVLYIAGDYNNVERAGFVYCRSWWKTF